MGPLEGEMAAAQVLQHGVVRHFRLSCLEARRRSNPARSRYAWHVRGGALYLWMPNFMPGRRRRAWLEAHVEDPDPSMPGERRRVQRIVDEYLGIPAHVRMESSAGLVDVGALAQKHGVCSASQELTVRDLARVVAEEKAENIHRQRRAIQALGAARLEELILHIFEDLAQGIYEEKLLAEAFGLSRPTFSRFAGSRWRDRPSGRIPDLWANMAQTLGSCGLFVDAAQKAALLPGARVIPQRDNPQMSSTFKTDKTNKTDRTDKKEGRNDA